MLGRTYLHFLRLEFPWCHAFGKTRAGLVSAMSSSTNQVRCALVILCRRGLDIHTSGKETTLVNSIFFVLGLSEVGRVWGIKALFDGVFLQLWSVAAECSGEDCFGDDRVSWKQVSEWIHQSWFESSVERLNPKLRVSKEVMLLP